MNEQFSLFDTLEDTEVLRAIVSNALPADRIVRIVARLVPQVGPNQGLAQNVCFPKKNANTDLEQFMMSKIEKKSLDRVGTKKVERFNYEDTIIYTSTIAWTYDVNIGTIAIAVRGPISVKKIRNALFVFEQFVAFRKQAIALLNQSDFLHLDVDSLDNLDSKIGTIIHKSIQPAATIIYRDSAERPTHLRVAHAVPDIQIYPSKVKDPAGRAFTRKKTIVIENTRAAVLSDGMAYSDTAYLNGRSHRAAIYVPVVVDGEVTIVIGCYFNRVNAISIIEKYIIEEFACLLARFYHIWKNADDRKKREAEAARILNLSKTTLLIAEIMHDLSEDIVIAHGHLDNALGKTATDIGAIERANALLSELKSISLQFRNLVNKPSNTKAALQVHRRYGKAGNHLQAVNLHEMVEAARHKFNKLLEQGKIALEAEYRGNLSIKCVRLALRSALENAIKNSIIQLWDQTHRRRRILIRCREIVKLNRRHIRISVHDNGPGAHPEDIERLRQPFESGRPGGVGLGLAIIDGAVEAHGGDCQIRTEWGKFFEVTIEFPADPSS